MSDDRVAVYRRPWPPTLVVKESGTTRTFAFETRGEAVSFAPRHPYVLPDLRIKTAAMFAVGGVIGLRAGAPELAITLSRLRLLIGIACGAAAGMVAAVLALTGHWVSGVFVLALTGAAAWQLITECRHIAQLAIQELPVPEPHRARA